MSVFKEYATNAFLPWCCWLTKTMELCNVWIYVLRDTINLLSSAKNAILPVWVAIIRLIIAPIVWLGCSKLSINVWWCVLLGSMPIRLLIPAIPALQTASTAIIPHVFSANQDTISTTMSVSRNALTTHSNLHHPTCVSTALFTVWNVMIVITALFACLVSRCWTILVWQNVLSIPL